MLKKFIEDHWKTMIAIGTFIIIVLGYLLNRKKSRLDINEIRKKHPNFNLYLENGYHLKIADNGERISLFNLRITNKATSKNTAIVRLKIYYFTSEGKRVEFNTDHDPLLFAKTQPKILTEFPKEIKLDEKEIKSGWVIFNFPSLLLSNRIDFYEISIQDSDGNKASVISNILKEVSYESNI